MSKRKNIYFLIISLMSLACIILQNKSNVIKKNAINTTNITNITNTTTVLSQEERKTVVNNIGNILTSKENEYPVVSINNEIITRKDIELYEFKTNNLSEEKSCINFQNELVEEVALNQEAQKQNINLTEDELNNLKIDIKKTIEQDNEISELLLSQLNMSKEEFIEYYSEIEAREEINLKLKRKIIKQIYDRRNIS